jgi:perosamine synthetase
MPSAPTESLPFFRGRAGLYHLLRTLDIGPGDDVLLQAFTCLAVPEAVMATGARPVWVDLAPDSVNLSLEGCLERITPRTKAIIVQHTFGIPADLQPLLEFARSRQLPLIEDCCHSFASTYSGRPVGTMGDGAFWSFEWGKPVVAGIGGAARFNDSSRQERLAAAHRGLVPPPARKEFILDAQYLAFTQSYSPRTFWWVRRAFRLLGRLRIAESNYNPVGPDVALSPEFSWRMARGAARRLPGARHAAEQFEAQRRSQAALYRRDLAATATSLPPVPAAGEAVYSRFPLFVSNKNDVLRAAARRNLEVAEWFATPVHPLEGAALAQVHYRPGSCPEAESAAKRILSLPVHPSVTPAFQQAVVELINRHGRS